MTKRTRPAFREPTDSREELIRAAATEYARRERAKTFLLVMVVAIIGTGFLVYLMRPVWEHANRPEPVQVCKNEFGREVPCLQEQTE